MLIDGTFSLLGVLPLVLLGGFGKIVILFFIGILNLVQGVGLVVVSFVILDKDAGLLLFFITNNRLEKTDLSNLLFFFVVPMGVIYFTGFLKEKYVLRS